ncbi:ABC transporter substrate-binding protein [Methylobacterium indicum]|uniref:ABC transporter substrate-binding protein n=1 Tax=Methylobacterium indicum TaxID=1775910 RepID=A0A8H9C1J1_9HYPH|nr:extracellular solute-binding protein [Methylobacterium indicum]BCM81677.1 ABC transporter substrate-binding protein [Methylobacterium indicum]
MTGEWFETRRGAGRRLCRVAAALALTAAIGLAGSHSATAQSQTLTINTDRSGAGQKAAMTKIASEFEAKNPGVKVAINFSDVESYKTSIRNFLVTTPPDVAFWFTGARMRTFTKRNLFEDLTGFFSEQKLDEPMKPFLAAVSDGDKRMMMPTNFTTWGFYYNKELFKKAGVEPPKTWADLMAAAAKLKAAGLIPFTIGTRDLWANDLWFDYLDLRENGLDFHMRLMDGKESYTDPRVKKVFSLWAEPVTKGYFLENASSYGWQEAIPLLSQGRAAMYLLGPYVLTSLPAELHDKIGFFPFPTVNPAVPNYEELSVNGVAIPSGAKNKALARQFLAFLAQPDNIAAFAKAGAVLPARTDVMLDDPFSASQVELAKAAKGSSQFYDRDTDPEMAQIGMKGFQEFLANPDRSEAILQRLEAARARIFK